MIFIISLTVSSLSAQEAIRFVYYADYAPFGWEENGEMVGIYIDIVEEVFSNRLGIPVEHRGYPWRRAQMMVRAGEADAFCTAITQERLSYSDASDESIIDVHFKMFALADSPKLDQLELISSVSELQEFILVDLSGSGWAQQNLENQGLDIEWLPTGEQLWKFLLSGRADVTVRNEWTARHTIRQLGYENQIIELSQQIVADYISFHIFISKKSSFRLFLDDVDETIRQLKSDGTLERILDKYR